MSEPITVENGSRKRVVDWYAIEIEYRLGERTLRAIAEDHGITEGAIRKKAKTYAWPRDLSKRIKAQAEALLMEASDRHITPEERAAVLKGERKSAIVRRAEVRESAEVDLVRQTAQKMADVWIQHRAAADDAYSVAARNISEIKNIRNESLKVRVRLFTAAVLNLRTAQTIHREAYGISDEQPANVNVIQMDGGTLRELLSNVGMTRRLGKA